MTTERIGTKCLTSKLVEIEKNNKIILNPKEWKNRTKTNGNSYIRWQVYPKCKSNYIKF